MKMTRNSCAVVILFISWTAAGPWLVSAQSNSDVDALWDFYNHTMEPRGVLSNWTTNTPACLWFGVKCDSENVTGLLLGNTNLRGTIPESIGNLANLVELDLSNNFFSGPIPESVGKLTKLVLLDLSHNFLNGPIQGSISKLTNLANFTVDHNELDESIPDDLGSSGSLVIVDLSENFLSGAIPSAICQSPGLKVLTLTNNLLNGSISTNMSNCGALENLFLGTNSLVGLIPDSIGTLGSLTILDLSSNSFTGRIPGKFQTTLTYLNLQNNSLSGNISSQLGDLAGLTLLSLASNDLEGPIPPELGNLQALGRLLLHDNQLSGHIPSSLGNLTVLEVLDLSNNQLTGGIPVEFGMLHSVTTLLLKGNNLDGSIPSSLQFCVHLLDLELGQNTLVGSIPPEIGTIASLNQLNLSWNAFGGPIPDTLGSLQKLERLDLSHNQLVGKVPEGLDKLTSLLYINLAYNSLNGSIPNFRPGLVNKTQFEGNPGLCGVPLLPCDSGNGNGGNGRNIHVWTAIVTGIGVASLLIIVGAVVFCYWRFRYGYAPTEVEPKIPSAEGRLFVDDDRPLAFSFEEVVEATQLLSQTNPVGKGRFSTVYRVVMPSGQEIAAKKLKVDTDNSSLTRIFTSELHKIEKMQHRNLLRLLGYVLQGDSLLLLYDFCPNGSLGEWLQRRPESVLEWSARYKIAVESAQGLAFLHHNIHPPFIHRDVNTNNILLNAEFEPLLGDVGLAKLYDPSKETDSMTAVAGSFGYIAPEYAYTMRVTEKSNVYSFGVVLLEILTGKQPVEPSFGEGCDLVSWVHSAPQRKEMPEQLLDASVSTASFAVRQEMLSVLKVAKLCTSALPAERPRMKVCLRCTFRFLNVRDPVYSISLPTPGSVLTELSSIHADDSKEKLLKQGDVELGLTDEAQPCLVCLGILHHLDPNEEESDIQRQDSRDASNSGRYAVPCVSAAIHQAGHTFDTFCLEVSLPALISLRERSLWCYLKEKHIVTGQDVNEHIVSLKEAVKWSLIERLKRSLSAKFDSSSTFRIALVYKHLGSAADIEFLTHSAGGDAKRRRHGQHNNNQAGFAAVVATRTASEAGESIGSVQRALASMDNDSFMRHYPCPPSKVKVSCELTAMCWRSSVYVGGRYLKLSRNISQSRWLVDDERMGEGSVQEIVGDVVFPYFKADSYKFHAAGREDIDVRMLGDGRPFIIEIVNARLSPSPSEMIKAEAEINAQKESWVKVRGLRLVGSEVCALMREGETDKQKEYVAVVWLSRPVTQIDFKCLSDLKELEIQQNTPVRVLHRRSSLIRPRIIHSMRCEEIKGSEQYFLLHLCTQAGTYIKEFVHGDLGRTHPNVGSLLGCAANILQLDVTAVKMDFE